MSDPFIGEIRMFSGTFAPVGWALCDGQLLDVSSNEALFSLIGTIYGGNGRTTFALPDLRGRLPLHEGTGPGLPNRPIGSSGGAETHTLTSSEMVSSHNHALRVSTQAATTANPVGNLPANATVNAYISTETPTTDLSSTAIDAATTPGFGGGAHNNMMPYATLNFIIALVGVFPTQT